MKIYQIYHDEQSEKLCTKDNPFVFPLDVSKLGITNQLAEARAYFYAIKNLNKEEYIGFTTYRHNQKFINCAKMESLTKELIGKGFKNEKVKLISFDPTHNFMLHINEFFNGMDKVMNDFLKEEYSFVGDIGKESIGKSTPLCSSFVMKQDEFIKFFQFFNKFINYIDKKYGIQEYPLDIIVGDKGRGWGYFCEMLVSFYLVYYYGKDFKIAYINGSGEIDER